MVLWFYTKHKKQPTMITVGETLGQATLVDSTSLFLAVAPGHDCFSVRRLRWHASIQDLERKRQIQTRPVQQTEAVSHALQPAATKHELCNSILIVF